MAVEKSKRRWRQLTSEWDAGEGGLDVVGCVMGPRLHSDWA